MSLYTIGHSTRPITRFLELLGGTGIELLVDVRRFPVSRRYPHFSRERLAASLLEAGIEYQHAEALGGHREPENESANEALRSAALRGYADHMQQREFAEALTTLQRAAEQREVVVMCAEADPRNCHRSLLADALFARGVVARHILEHEIVPHLPNTHAVFHDQRVSYPSQRGKAQPSLFPPNP